MKTKIEIKSIFGKLLFEFEKENNTVKETLLESIKIGADLSYADLRGANLSYANLSSANLGNAYLIGADLRSADLSYADLSYADLSYADLSGAILQSTKNLEYALCSFNGHGECGRQLLAIKINEEIILFCGCFKGNEKELRDYILNGDKEYIESRTIALDTVLKLIEIKR